MWGSRAWIALVVAAAIAGCGGDRRGSGTPGPLLTAGAPSSAACAERLQAFWGSLQAYARAHEGRLPAATAMSEVMVRLGSLAPAGERADLCPLSLLPYAWNEAAAGRPLADADGTLPLLFDDFLFGEHADGHCLALCADGQIRAMSKRDLEAQVLRSERAASAPMERVRPER